MSLTDYTENNLIGWLKGVQMPAPPGTLYVALYTATPGEAGGGTEVSGGAYARQIITLSDAPSPVSNTNNIAFPQATANWGVLLGAALVSAPSAGNILAYEAFATVYQKSILVNDIVEFAAGALTFSIT